MTTEKERLKKSKWYSSHKTIELTKAKTRYANNRESILLSRKEARKKESSEAREKRLAFHTKYNALHADKRKRNDQTDKRKFYTYQKAAERRGYQFLLEFRQFVALFHANCVYCNKLDSRGIDRVDNRIGYTIANSSPCCEMCNKMKWRWTQKQFLGQIKLIYQNKICHEQTQPLRGYSLKTTMLPV